MDIKACKLVEKMVARFSYASLVDNRLASYYWKIAVLSASVVLSSGCRNDPSPESAGPGMLSFKIPQALSERSTIQLTSLRIVAELEGSELTPVEMSIHSGSVLGVLNEVPYGDYILNIVFSYVDTESETEVITLSKALEVSETEINVHFQESDFHYPDADLDGYTNLSEINASTDPLDKYSHVIAAKMFVTSESGNGKIQTWSSANGLKGVAAADNICQSAAANASIEGEFVAWMSDYDNDAYCRVLGLSGLKNNDCNDLSGSRSAGPWARLDGNPFAADLDALVNLQKLYTSPNIDENGWQLGAAEILWTGTSRFGEGRSQGDGAKINDCNNWSSMAASQVGLIGTSSRTVHDWSEDYFESCSSAGHLLCLEASAKAAVPDAKVKGKTVFVTSMGGSGDIGSWLPDSGFEGVDAADYVCRTSARDAKLSNPEKFKAWLSVDGVFDAAERLGGEGPWVRTDGVLLARDHEQFRHALLNTSPSLNEKGNYLWNFVITGTDSHTGRAAAGDKHCNGWMSGTEEYSAAIGFSVETTSDWSHVEGYSPSGDCAYPDYHLYCFETD